MFNKTSKIIIIICLGINIQCFSQVKNSEDSILIQYNNYLQAVHLNGLVNAVNFGQQDDVIQNGSAGATRLKSVFVLTIQPTATYSNPLVFGSIWKKATNVVNENILYWQMFGKLADYSHRPLDSVAVFIKSRKPEIASYLVYFDKGLKVNAVTLNTKGGPDLPKEITSDGLNNPLYSYVFNRKIYKRNYEDIKADLTKAIIGFLHDNHLGKYIEGESVVAREKPETDNIVFFEARNLRGFGRKNIYEEITIRLIVIPLSSKEAGYNPMTVFYSLNIMFSGRKFADSYDNQNAENAVVNPERQVTDFGEKLLGIFNDVLSQ